MKFLMPVTYLWEGEVEIEAKDLDDAIAQSRNILVEEDPSCEGWDGCCKKSIHGSIYPDPFEEHEHATPKTPDTSEGK